MWTFPVLLDCRPAFLPRAHFGSLLLTPLGNGTVLSHLRARLATVTGAPPVIAARFEIQPDYEAALRSACPDVERVVTLPAFAERMHSYEPSDRLLLADPTCFPLGAQDPGIARLNEEDDDPGGVKHLVAIQRGGDGTKEYLDADASGRIRAIQRYYDAVTWPLGGGVACSLVPVASVRVSYELPLASLTRMRRILASEGVPSRDIPLEQGAVNLATERGLLAMNERLVLELARWTVGSGGERSRLWRGTGTRVHPSANLVGAVVLQDGARVGEGATLIGPAVIGRDAVVEARATVAQSVVGAGQVVASATTLRHRVYLGAGDPASANGGESASLVSEIWETQPLAMGSRLAPRSFYPVVKRAFDATVAALVLLLLLPLCLLLAALVKLESKGPIFFGHIREGLGGKAFRCWKFRTMFVGADQQQRKLQQLNQMDGPQFKVRRDPRRTVLGRFLTASNVDELPQLWNVLVGEMSLVGPRPSPFRENQVCVPWREGRLSVRPGITGLWQICRHDRDKGDFHQWIYYDLLYVRHMSLLLDLKIMFLTLVAFAKGGYIPLSWLLSPRQYGERRTTRRPPDEAGAADRIRAEASEAS